MKIELTKTDGALRGRIKIALTHAQELVTGSWHDAAPYLNENSWVSFASAFLSADDTGMKADKIPLPFDSPEATLFSLAAAVNRGCNQKLPGFVPFTPTTSVGPRSGDIIGFVIERLADPPGGTSQKNLHALKITPKPAPPPPETPPTEAGAPQRAALRTVAPALTVEEKFDIVLVTQNEAIRVLSGILAEIDEIDKLEAAAGKKAQAEKPNPELVAALAKVPPVVAKHIEALRAEIARLNAELTEGKAKSAAPSGSKPAEAVAQPQPANLPVEAAPAIETPPDEPIQVTAEAATLEAPAVTELPPAAPLEDAQTGGGERLAEA